MYKIMLFDTDGRNKRMRLFIGNMIVATEYITGIFSHPRYWFKSLQNRIEIATSRLTDVYNENHYNGATIKEFE